MLPKRSADGGRASFVDFLDIKSAVKAHVATHKMANRELRTNYNEPGAKFSFGRHARGAGISRRRYEQREGYCRLLSWCCMWEYLWYVCEGTRMMGGLQHLWLGVSSKSLLMVDSNGVLTSLQPD